MARIKGNNNKARLEGDSSRKKFYESFAKSFTTKRKATGLNQSEMALVIGRSAFWVNHVERAKIEMTFFDAMKLVNLLNIPLDNLKLLADCELERSRLRSKMEKFTADIETEIAEAEERLKALREQKLFAARAVGRSA